jgi:hypothetical protein
MKTKFLSPEHKELTEALCFAEKNLRRYLQKEFANGARCGVILKSGQLTGTPATIVGVEPSSYGGTVTVSIDTAKTNSRQRFRSIPFGAVSLESVSNQNIFNQSIVTQ